MVLYYYRYEKSRNEKIFIEKLKGVRIMKQTTKQKKYFYCYNLDVSNFLKSKGIEYITLAINKNSGSQYSLYERDDDLRKALSEYKKTRAYTA